MSGVNRYDAVHIRHEENNIRYGEGCEVEMVTASDYDRLEQECERLKSIYEQDTRRLTGVNALADDLKADRDQLRAQVEAMRAAGLQLSNAAFNLAQRSGYSLTQRDCDQLSDSRKRWDAALQAKP